MLALIVATLASFVTKSLLDGALWPVPWQLVALMGMSQAGYVAPKFHYGKQGQENDVATAMDSQCGLEGRGCAASAQPVDWGGVDDRLLAKPRTATP